MKKILFSMLGIALVVMSCNKLPDETEPDIPPEPTDTIPNIPQWPVNPDSIIILPGCDTLLVNTTDGEPERKGLAGTKWKLQGILNGGTCELQILRPTDIERYYTLEFDSDSTANGFCTVNMLYAILSHDGTARIVVTTEALDTRKDPMMFENILPTVKSYLHEQSELQFICEDEKYLLFKKVEL